MTQGVCQNVSVQPLLKGTHDLLFVTRVVIRHLAVSSITKTAAIEKTVKRTKFQSLKFLYFWSGGH